MLQAWQPLWQSQLHTRYGWQKVSGPLSALIQYLQDLGVDGQEPLCWKWDGHTLDIDIEDPCLLGRSAPFWRRWWQLGGPDGSARPSLHRVLKKGWTGQWRVVCFVQRNCRCAGPPTRWCSKAFTFMKGTRDCPSASGVANATLRSTCCMTAINCQAQNPRLNGCWIIAPRSRMTAYGSEECCPRNTSTAMQSMSCIVTAFLPRTTQRGDVLCTRRTPQEDVILKTPG